MTHSYLVRGICASLLALSLFANAFAQTALDFGRGGPQVSFYFLLDSDVQTDLALSEDQVDQIDKIKMDMQKGISMTLSAMLPGEGEKIDTEKISAALTKHTKTADDSSKKVLTKSQSKRFSEIELQLLSGYALARPDVQKKLKLTKSQQSKIKEKIEKGPEGSGGGRNVTTVAQMKALEEKQKQSLLSLLSKDQAAKFKQMQGKPMKRKKRA